MYATFSLEVARKKVQAEKGHISDLCTKESLALIISVCLAPQGIVLLLSVAFTGLCCSIAWSHKLRNRKQVTLSKKYLFPRRTDF